MWRMQVCFSLELLSDFPLMMCFLYQLLESTTGYQYVLQLELIMSSSSCLRLLAPSPALAPLSRISNSSVSYWISTASIWSCSPPSHQSLPSTTRILIWALFLQCLSCFHVRCNICMEQMKQWETIFFQRHLTLILWLRILYSIFLSAQGIVLCLLGWRGSWTASIFLWRDILSCSSFIDSWVCSSWLVS